MIGSAYEIVTNTIKNGLQSSKNKDEIRECKEKIEHLEKSHTIEEIKDCKEKIRKLEMEVAGLNAFQRIVEGSLEINIRGGNK
ncbi:hypothetical protein MSMTP_2674 [Methanosarcina sp. MTP4]|uniref:hypothetical protein n=1 Tax=Methanosarcina sp. MTP4 TaxID=1434100 RepID=UPI0006156C62|nr:hypothetical protein [Methanosarcina sp. MTP4]AKB26143.1 hypothetical protein MSMTP_2674 [Methanosarcina sp. MTP4]